MKKTISLFISLLLISSCTISAFATNLDTNITNALAFYKTTFEASYALPSTDANHKNADVWTLYCLAHSGNLTNADYAFMVPTVDPTKAAGYNNPADVAKDILAQAIIDSTAIDATIVANLVSRQAADGNFKDKAAKTTVNDDIWSIIALEVASANGVSVNYNKAKAVSALMALQKPDGGFTYITDINSPYYLISNADTTEMALISLSIAGADCTSIISYLGSILDSNGNFVGKDEYAGANSCTQAYGIMGLIAAGEDVTAAKWTKNGKTIVDVLLAYQDDNGGFWYDRVWSTAPDNFSTFEAIMALSDVASGANLWTTLATPKLIETITDTSVSETTTTTTSALATSSIPPTGEKPINPLILIVLGIAVVALIGAFAAPAFKKKMDGNKDVSNKDDEDE